MPLIDLKTNLKTLRFGNDQPGYGSSGLPYIQTAIPDVINATGTFNPIFRPGSTGNLDFPIRGGDIKFNIGTQTFTLSTQIDKTRIRKFFEDAPRGKAFIEKQIGLQLSNPKIETGNTLYGFGQSATLPGLLENTRVYNKGLNTLAQVGASGTGAHAIRHGLMPFNPFQKHYYDIVNSQNVDNQSENNRLLILNNLKMSSGLGQIANANEIGNINTVNTLGISLNKNFIFQYWGGPGSTYGIGVTTVKRVVDTTKLMSSNAMTYDQLRTQNSNFGNPIPKIQDFRDALPTFVDYTPWENNEIDKRFYVSPGFYQDKMNLLGPLIFNNNQAPWETGNDKTDDLIKFVFEAISNDNTSLSTALFFRAFLTAGLTDNNSATLNPFKYMGRGENFYTYQGFDRSISFSFRVAAGSKDELKPLYNKVNSLISQVYPDYSAQSGIMRAPVVRVTIGDYLYRVPGFLESVNITVDNNYPWEINLEKSQLGDVAQLPQVLDIAISFKPIMDILPKRASIDSITKSSRSSLSSDTIGSEVYTDTTTVSTNIPALIANVKFGPPENETNFINPGTTLSQTVSQRSVLRSNSYDLLQSIPKQDFRGPLERSLNNRKNVLLKSTQQGSDFTRQFEQVSTPSSLG
jgi:hypothetical protein